MARKMLVSDYDGTLKSDLKNLIINIEAVKEFRKQGNLFTISTGRSYDSIKSECDRYGIKYDFLNCCDGSVLFDGQDNLLFANKFSRPDLIALAVTLSHEESIKEVNYYGTHGIVDVNHHKIGGEGQSDIVMINLKLRLFKSIKAYISGFEKDYQNIKFAQVFNEVFIKDDFYKSDGIQKLEEYLNGEITRDNIITVGDNLNDLKLLQEYGGYKMLTSYPCMYRKGLKTTREVHTLLKKINR